MYLMWKKNTKKQTNKLSSGGHSAENEVNVLFEISNCFALPGGSQFHSVKHL
jgi:hypothetical protein